METLTCLDHTGLIRGSKQLGKNTGAYNYGNEIEEVKEQLLQKYSRK